MRRSAMYHEANGAFGPSTWTGSGRFGSDGKPDDRPEWPAEPSGSKGHSRRAHVSGHSVPCDRRGFGLGGTSVVSRRRLSLPRWRSRVRDSAEPPGNRWGWRDGRRATVCRHGRRQSSGRSTGKPIDRTERQAGNRKPEGPVTGHRRARWATSGPDGSAGGRPPGGMAGDSPPRGVPGNR